MQGNVKVFLLIHISCIHEPQHIIITEDWIGQVYYVGTKNPSRLWLLLVFISIAYLLLLECYKACWNYFGSGAELQSSVHTLLIGSTVLVRHSGVVSATEVSTLF